MTRSSPVVLTILVLLAARAGWAQQSSDYLPASQVEELDREGQILDGDPPLGKPPLDCPDILERVPRSQLTSIEKNASRYLVMPNGDVIDAYRALAMRELEDRMRTVTASARDRLQREYDELAPQGQIRVRYPNGDVSYNDTDAKNAEEGDTVFEYVELPPLFELPIRPQPETTAAYVLLGSRMESPEQQSFGVIQQTDHWLIGFVEQDGRRVSQRIAVHRRGARFAGSELERSCVLWPLNKTAESRREYWDRSPLPLYVSIYFEDVRATPADIACAVEKGQATLRNHTVNTDRSRTVSRSTEPSQGTGLVRRTREYGPWVQKITWRSTPVSVRVMPYDEFRKRQAAQLEREDRRPETDDTPTPEVTHTLRLGDGRSFNGRLASEPDADPIRFVIVVGNLEQEMTFSRRQIESIERVKD